MFGGVWGVFSWTLIFSADLKMPTWYWCSLATCSPESTVVQFGGAPEHYSLSARGTILLRASSRKCMCDCIVCGEHFEWRHDDRFSWRVRTPQCPQLKLGSASHVFWPRFADLTLWPFARFKSVALWSQWKGFEISIIELSADCSENQASQMWWFCQQHGQSEEKTVGPFGESFRWRPLI